MSIIDDQVSAVLRTAAALLEEYGWVQGTSRHEHSGAMCITYAVYLSADHCGYVHNNSTGCILRAAQRRMIDHLGIFWSSLVKWNDAPGRTKDEVIAALLGAANGEKTEKKE